MSLVSAILNNDPPPKFKGKVQRHVMDNRPATGTTYCRDHSLKIRLANIETIFAAVIAGNKTITEIEDATKISRCTITRALASLALDQRVTRQRWGKQVRFAGVGVAVNAK